MIFSEKIHRLKTDLTLKKNFSIIQKIGKGKDGVIYRCRDRENKEVIVKILSKFGRQYLPLTKEYARADVTSDHLYRIQIIADSIIVYPYEDLSIARTNPRQFLEGLRQVAELEIDLIRCGLYYWDLGFVDHGNYMMDNHGRLKIVDYGGNAFLLLDEQKNVAVAEPRKNLIYAQREFVTFQLISHIYYFGLGRRTKELYPSLAQHWDTSTIVEFIERFRKELSDTIYGKIVESFIRNNALTAAGWQIILNTIEETLVLAVETEPQEPADIASVSYKDNGVEVRGYQNFNVSSDSLVPFSHDNRPLWDTEVKYRLVDKALQVVTQRSTVNSFLDIGSNLGLYVFLSRIKYLIPACTGIDYNAKYIETCQDVVNHLALSQCRFEKKSFNEITSQYDCVLAMGIIHHLFHRTEEYGSLDKILNKFNSIVSTSLILEFPTEKDAKAMKWTNIPGRNKDEEYSLANFTKYAARYFPKIEKIGEVHKTRLLYLLTK